MTIRILLLVLFIVGLADLRAQSRIDTSRSEIIFDVSNLALRTVTGRMGGMTGTVRFDTERPGAAVMDVCVDARSVRTGNDKRDAHLLEEDFFHTEEYPLLCFEADTVLRVADGFEATGRLTMRGVTRTVTIPFTREGEVLTGSVRVDRMDYDIGTSYRKFTVGHIIDVRIRCVLLN